MWSIIARSRRGPLKYYLHLGLIQMSDSTIYQFLVVVKFDFAMNPNKRFNTPSYSQCIK